jgi:hypothetical protein
MLKDLNWAPAYSDPYPSADQPQTVADQGRPSALEVCEKSVVDLSRGFSRH